MARELEHFEAPGLTVYAKPLPLSDSPAWGTDAVSMPEDDDIDGYYTADVGSPAYPYAVFKQAGGSPAATDGPACATIDVTISSRASQTSLDTVDTTADTISAKLGSFAGTGGDDVKTKLDAVPGLIGGGSGISPATIWAYATRALTSGVVTVVQPIQSGTLNLVQGDSYLHADGTAVSITKTNGAVWPTDITGWTITFTCAPNDDTLTETPSAVGFSATGTVVTATGASQAVRIDMTATQTATLTHGTAAYRYDVQASNGSSRSTLELGTINVARQVTTA